MPYLHFDNKSNFQWDTTPLEEYLDFHHRAFVFGQRGFGKTSILLKILAKYKTNKYEAVFLRGSELSRSFDFLSLSKILSKAKYGILIVDDYDLIIDPAVRKEVGRLYGDRRIKILFSSTKLIETNFHEERGDAFYMREVSAQILIGWIEDQLKKRGIRKAIDLKKVITKYPKTPLIAYRILELILEGYNLTEVEKNVIPKFEYQSKIFLPEEKKIIVPQQKIILANAYVLETSLLKKIKGNINEIFKFTDREFEEFVAELYHRDGYEVSITQQTRDGGKDIILSKDSSVGKSLYYVECKKYATHRPVSIGVVQRMYGVVQRNNATKGIVVTSSSFSNPAKLETQKIQHQIALVDYFGLEKFVKRLNADE